MWCGPCEKNARESRRSICSWPTRFYRLLNLLGEVNLPPRGSDFALSTGRSVDALLQSAGSHPSVGGEIARLGFSSAQISYTKEKRAAGDTKWTLKNEAKSVRGCFCLVLLRTSAGHVLSRNAVQLRGIWIRPCRAGHLIRLMTRTPVQGWASLIVVVLVLGGVQMMMLGILGEYLWRTLEAGAAAPDLFPGRNIGVRRRQLKPNRKKWGGVLGRSFRVQSAAVGVLIGLGCLAILLRQVDLKQSWNALGQLNGPFLLVPLAVFFVNLPLRAWRWQLIFPGSSRPSFGYCLTVLGIGNMANFLLPGRAGDLARCVLVGRAGSLRESSRTLATLAVEKVLDGLALAGMVLFAVWALHPPHWVLGLLRVAVLLFGGALLLLVVLRYRTRALIDFVRRGFELSISPR